ncbi:MAG: hypothetical protein JWO96_279 [Candidatus Saccharibacteria bacterium]|nr:hypothetical protein [Candidatus Saccharibacteria bacterium]
MPGLNETAQAALERYLKATSPQAATEHYSEAADVDREHSRKALRTAGALLSIVGVAALAQANTTARVVNGITAHVENIFNVPSPPKPENATNISVGDVISYTDKDGNTKKRRVSLLSDITVAASQVDPSIDQAKFNNMLISEHSSSMYHVGDTYMVDKNLGIKDIGPSG